MKYLKLYEDYKKNEWSILIDEILKSEFLPITDELWESINMDGYSEEVNDYEGDFDRNNYTYMEIELSDKDRIGLINMDEDVLERYNDFDVYFKAEGYYPEYIDLIDYDEGKIYIIKHK